MKSACLALVLSTLAAAAASDRRAMEFAAPAGLPDIAQNLSPADIHLEGWLGERVMKNESVRLVNVDVEPLLAGYRRKPGVHPWIGEHIVKWMHAATLAWAYTGDEALRRKLDYAAAELVKAQEPDGYLGTYTPDKRFGLFKEADWDVWSHKYCLLGLLTYYQYTGDAASLAAARKAGDLLISTFGPGKKSINSAGTHVGMAATSVLEPMVLLYRCTADVRYLDFARYITQAWREPKGAKIIDALLTAKQVNKTANAKAYEMLSNLVGLCELARATGDRSLLDPVVNAWEDIVARRLYITGSASSHEHFQDDYHLPNDPKANVGETCVTTTWIQLNAQLLRLTGSARYANEPERSFYNHLAAAQRPDGAQWCYYTSLEGAKPYGPGINCCVSSGPRGMALVPQQLYLVTRADGDSAQTVLVSTFESSRVTATLDGKSVSIEQKSDFPRSGHSTLTVHTARPARFALAIRAPTWARPLSIGFKNAKPEMRDGWMTIPAREWNDGERVEVSFVMAGSYVAGTHENAGTAALMWGPFVLAFDQSQNGGEAPSSVSLAPDAKPRLVKGNGLTFETSVRSTAQPAPHPAIFVPFADAGSSGGHYQVWLRTGSGSAR